MKRHLWVTILFAFTLLCTAPVHAETQPLGDGNVAVKLDYFRFMSSSIQDVNAGNGVYIGVEAYKELFFEGFYLGGEIGWAGASGDVDIRNFGSIKTDIDYVPIELNAKYAVPLGQGLVFDAGGGFSINYFGFSQRAGALNTDDSDWVWGGQLFVDLNYRYQNWLLGAAIKYQLTQDLSLGGANAGFSADNLRLGVQAGYKF